MSSPSVFLSLRAAGFAVVMALAAPTAFAQPVLQLELDAPDAVRPLLEKHLRLFSRDGEALPEDPADRAALARRTRREVAELLATEGFFRPDVQLRRAPDGQWRLIVDPGPQARVTEVDLRFEGDLARDEGARRTRREALRAAWRLPAGAGFRQSDWDGAKQVLLDGVAARDYAAARVAESRAEVDPAAGTVRLSVTIDSGPPFFLGPLDVTGLQALPPDFVAHYSTLEPGERFDQDRLLELQGVLQNAPQFASVIVDIERDPALAAAVPVRVHVAEAQSRHLGFGVGYSTNNGYRTEMSWRDVNLFDRGWELSSGLRVEQFRQSAYADVFFPPVGGGHRYSVGGALDRSEIEGLALTTQAVGVTRITTRGEIETRIGLRFQHELRQPDGAESTHRNALTLSWAWTQRRVDNLFDPREGHVLQVELGGGSKAALSDQDFFRAYGRFVRYQPVAARDVLILRAEGGATLADSREGVPQDFLFRAGGSQSVRGYAYQSLGVQEGDATVGGRYLATLSAEYVRWFSPQWGGAAFIDAGDAADDRNVFSLKTGYGVGARWRSPAGPLAIDLAYGRETAALRLHFGIAIAF